MDRKPTRQQSGEPGSGRAARSAPSLARVTLVGLGPGSPDALTVGALAAIRQASAEAAPLLVRTRRHPVVDWLRDREQLSFDRAFDDLYDTADRFDQVYEAIATEVIDAARAAGHAVYAVPGHPLIGERSVQLLLGRAVELGIAVQVTACSSLIDAVLGACQIEIGELKLVDALSVPDVTDKFRARPLPFESRVCNIVYQVYDRSVASRVKLALLEIYPPDFAVSIVAAAGIGGAERVESVRLERLDRRPRQFDHLTSLVVLPLAGEAPADMAQLADIMARLRDPQAGCPWDREQTRETLRRYLVEECYEVLEAMEGGDPEKYAEELGDLLLQVYFHCQLAREADAFTLADVVGHIVRKLIRRHPHVFGDVDAGTSEEVLRNWEAIKRAEPGYEERKSVLDGIPRALPALMRAQEVARRAARAGFEWESIEGVFAKLDEEVKELRSALIQDKREEIADEIGDMLFTVVNLARFTQVDAEDSLQRMVARFSRRFARIEQAAAEQGIALESLGQEQMEEIWQAAKREQTERRLR